MPNPAEHHLTADREQELEAAIVAWQEWNRLMRKAEKSLAFVDAHDAAQAWVRFQNLYLGHNNVLATMPSPTAVILPFGGAA